MNFKQALIAHLQGEKVECGYKGVMWVGLLDAVEGLELKDVLKNGVPSEYKFRLAHRTIMCNGVEVPAPEKVAPQFDTEYFVPCTMEEKWYTRTTWSGHDLEKLWLERGLVYLNKEDAIARAKAMLIVQEVK